MTSVAERLEPPAMYDWFVAQREAMGLTIVPMDADASGGACCVPCRRASSWGCCVTATSRAAASRSNSSASAPPCRRAPPCWRCARGPSFCPPRSTAGPGIDHTAVIMPPVPTERTGRLRQDVARVTQLIAADLEQLIRRAPEQWHLFQPNWPSDSAAGAPG